MQILKGSIKLKSLIWLIWITNAPMDCELFHHFEAYT